MGGKECERGGGGEDGVLLSHMTRDIQEEGQAGEAHTDGCEL